MTTTDSLHNALCRTLGIAYPIVQAPMAGGWTTPALVAAVTNAGGLGSLAAARTTIDGLDAAIAEVRARAAGTFAVNFVIAPPEAPGGDVDAVQRALDPIREKLGLPSGSRELSLPRSVTEEQFQLVLERRVPVISFAMGNPGEMIRRAHEAGAVVLVMVTTVEEAAEVAAQGADIIVAQGAEAGGHRSTFRVGSDAELPLIGTMALVPQVVDAVNVPVIAAGGIMDARGLVAALALGALGVQMGTRFLLARESGAFARYREQLRGTAETGTRVTRLLTGRPARALENHLLRTLQTSEVQPLPWPYQTLAAEDIYRAAAQRGMADDLPLLAGQGLRLCGAELGAAEIVQNLVAEAERLLERMTSELNV